MSGRVRDWLLALALVPFAGASWFAYHEVDEVSESRGNADTIAESTEELVRLTELRASLLDERNWSGASSGIRDIGFDLALVRAFTGIDLDELGRESQATVDGLLAEVGWPELATSVAEVRADPDRVLNSTADNYEQIADSVEERADGSLDALLTLAGNISNGSDLVATLRVLDASAVARQAVALQFSSYFGAQFTGGAAGNDELQTLAQQSDWYRTALADIARIAAADTHTIGALKTLELDDDVITFRAAIAALLEAPPPVADVEGLDVAGILAQIDTTAATLHAAAGSVEEHLALVEAASSDVRATSEAMDDAAADALRTALLRIGAVGAASLLFALGLARAIGRPLRKLAASAADLRDRSGMAALRPSGPLEVRDAMSAINEAAAHLELAERQAHALSLGELDSPVLTETAPGALGQSLQEAVRTLSSSLGESEEFQRRLAYEATHDSLTQLANRSASLAHLQKGLARSSRTGGTLAVMFVDLDDFKEVNDRHGHPAGDTVLRAISERMVAAVREGDHVGRIGGDEFVIVAEPVGGPAEAISLAKRVADAVAQPISVGSTTVSVSISIGIAFADHATALTPDELLHDADLAVYKAKETGRARIELCDDLLHAEVVHRALIEEALGEALLNDELTLYYQPIVDAGTAQVMSLEALVRWERPGIGLTPPDDFIPIAERSDLILALDNWVVRHAIEQLHAWRADDKLARVPVAINVSGRHLAADRFVADILDPIAEVGVDPALVVLEITEGALLADLESAARKLQLLRDKGIRIAIDDFGTGYTSLGHLRTLPVDILKIDRTFVADESASSLVKLIIDTGHLLGVSVTAEGIETKQQAAHLGELGSDDLQGYLFGRPVPPADLILDEAMSAPGPAGEVVI